MFSLRSDRALLALSRFAGRHLAIVSSILLKNGQFAPSGMTSTLSLWSGTKEHVTVIGGENAELQERAARYWFMADHGKASFVSVALNTISTIDDARTDAIMVSARLADHSAAILVFAPYTPAIDQAPLRLHEPQIDFAMPFAHLLSKQRLVLEAVLQGRNGSPLHRPSD
ncbi:hypothetical protein [Bradyrhizobium sp. ORS 285]|uniref:hypothetical protein n=1 Tax=Bradyrhizobium sp. ORS 285 TaxID=115808 RepID=UPI00054F0C11|nr:hypothetical protein [Bradyrhizobium sp. ORS 285]